MRCNSKHNVPSARVSVREWRRVFIRGGRWALITRQNMRNPEEKDWRGRDGAVEGGRWVLICCHHGNEGSRWKLSGRVEFIKASWYRNESRLLGLNWSRLDWSDRFQFVLVHDVFYSQSKLVVEFYKVLDLDPFILYLLLLGNKLMTLAEFAYETRGNRRVETTFLQPGICLWVISLWALTKVYPVSQYDAVTLLHASASSRLA